MEEMEEMEEMEGQGVGKGGGFSMRFHRAPLSPSSTAYHPGSSLNPILLGFYGAFGT